MRKQKKDTRENDEALDRLMGNARTYEEVQGVIAQLTKAVVERALRGDGAPGVLEARSVGGPTAATAGTAPRKRR